MNKEEMSTGPPLTAKDVQKQIQSKEKDKTKIYETFIKRINERIRVTIRTSVKAMGVLYKIPEMVFGLPIYDVAECASFLDEYYTKQGFDVYRAPPGTLWISWQKSPESRMPGVSFNFMPSYKPANNFVYSNNLLDQLGSRILKN
jgi:hypothetical protein